LKNISDRHLTQDEEKVLKKGLNFNANGRVPKEHFLAAIEVGVQHMNVSYEQK
jgi:hypothetical protein